MHEKITFFRKIIFFISFFCGTILPHDKKCRSHWAWVTDQIALGALPIKTKFLTHGGHHLKIIQQAKSKGYPLGLVVSVIQPFELKGEGILLKPVSVEDWKLLGVETVQLNIPDFSANASLDDIDSIVKKIKQTVNAGKSVYIHCKAGRARSWMVLMCYLTTEEGMDFNSARKLIKSNRIHVCPKPKQIKLALAYHKRKEK